MSTYSVVPPPQIHPPPPLPLRSIIQFLVLVVALFPAFCLMRIVGITSPSDTVSEFLTSNINGPNLIQSQYRILFTLESSRRNRQNAALASVASLIVTLIFSSLRHSSLLGSPLYNWSLLATVIFCGNYLLNAVIPATVAVLESRFGHRSKRWSYYLSNVCQPLGSVLHWTLIFVTWWFLHFATVVYPVTGYGAWVFGAWLLRCVLILVNEAVKARWRANAIYDRLEERILRAGFQIHILCSLIPTPVDPDIIISLVVPWKKKENEAEIIHVASEEGDICRKVEDHIRYYSGYRVTTKDVEAIARSIEGFTSYLPEGAADVAEHIRVSHGIAPDDGMHVDKRWLMEKLRLGDEDARVLYGELCALANSPDNVSFYTFSVWMNLAYQENQEVGAKLRVEQEKIINSDRFLLAVLISKAFLLWLFLTGKSTTQVIVVIPFVYFAKCFIDELKMPHFRTLFE